jgi:phosphatidylglycerophosphate synthase
MTSRMLWTWPNLVTCIRPVCTPVFLLCCAQAQSTGAAWARWGVLWVFVLIAGSDRLDGWLARRLAQVSSQGRTLDHVCDVLFIVAALGCFAFLGLVPWWLPSAIVWSFSLYAYDSWRRTAQAPQRQLLGSRLGHLGGILNYGAVGVVAVQLWGGGPRLPMALVQSGFIGLALLAGLAGTERLWLLWRASGIPSTVVSHRAGPGVENTSQSDYSSP